MKQRKFSQTKKNPVDLYGNPINLEKNKSKIPFENAYVDDCYKFIIMSGNNSQIIRKALEKRSWWIKSNQFILYLTSNGSHFQQE